MKLKSGHEGPKIPPEKCKVSRCHTHIPVSMKEALEGPLSPFHLIMPFCLLSGDGKAVKDWGSQLQCTGSLMYEPVI